MFAIRDVVKLYSPYSQIKEYRSKFHICVSVDPMCRLVFISSDMKPGNFPVNRREFLNRPEDVLAKEMSYVSHTELLPHSTQTLREQKAERICELSLDAYTRLIGHLRASRGLAAVDKKFLQLPQ